MNRIYQGRVTRVQRQKTISVEGSSGTKGRKRYEVEWEDVEDGETLLWRHHELFQDAITAIA